MVAHQIGANELRPAFEGETLNPLCRARLVAPASDAFRNNGVRMSEHAPAGAPGPELSPGRDTAADPLKEISDDQLPVGDHLQEQGRNANAPSRLVLAVIAFTVIDAVVVVMYIAIWAIDFNFLVKAFEGRGWISLLLSIIPLILGSLLLQRNKKAGADLPGARWGKAGLAIGALTGLLTLAVPIVATIERMMLPLGK